MRHVVISAAVARHMSLFINHIITVDILKEWSRIIGRLILSKQYIFIKVQCKKVARSTLKYIKSKATGVCVVYMYFSLFFFKKKINIKQIFSWYISLG